MDDAPIQKRRISFRLSFGGFFLILAMTLLVFRIVHNDRIETLPGSGPVGAKLSRSFFPVTFLPLIRSHPHYLNPSLSQLRPRLQIG
jgi:hypothetical protein